MVKKIGLFITVNLLILSCSASSPNASNTTGDQARQASGQDEIAGESRQSCQVTPFGSCVKKCNFWLPWTCW